MTHRIAIPRWADGSSPIFVAGDLLEPTYVPIRLLTGAPARLSSLEANWVGGTGWPTAANSRWWSARCVRVPGGYFIVPTGPRAHWAGTMVANLGIAT